MDLLAVDVDAIAEAKTAPGAVHSAGGLGFIELLDACDENLVDGLGFALPWVGVAGGTRQAEPRAKAFDGEHAFDSNRLRPSFCARILRV